MIEGNYVLSKLQGLLSGLPVLKPSNVFVIMWEFLYMVFVQILFVYIPFYVSFEEGDDYLLKKEVFFFFCVFFTLDIVKNFCTGLYIKGVLMCTSNQICVEYVMSGYLLYDVLTFFALIGLFVYRYSPMLFVLRVFYKPSLF